MTTSNSSPLDSHRTQIEEWLDKGKSYRSIVQRLLALGVVTSDRSLRRAVRRWNRPPNPSFDRESIKIDGDAAEFTTKPRIELGKIEDLIRENGLDPDDWEIGPTWLNTWDSPTGDTLKQLKVSLHRKKPHIQIVAARPDGWTPPKTYPVEHYESRLVAIVGDTQCPFHDEKLNDLFCQWLVDNEPEEGVILGDTIDLPDISRYPFDPENTATVNECLGSGYNLLRSYVSASPSTQWQKLLGNHDIRLRDYLIKHAQALYGLQRASKGDVEEDSVLTIPFLMRLDELGIGCIDPHGPYQEGQVILSPHLAVRHGWYAVKGSGASALRTLQHLGYSVVVGHTHRQSLVYHTTYDIDGQPSTLAAAEAGAMCQIDNRIRNGRRFPSYTVNPDWQNGWVTAEVWPDGKFRLEHATYAGGSVYWRDQRYG